MDVNRVAEALQAATESDALEATRHLWDELRADAFVLADVLSAIDSIYRIVDMGFDEAGHPKFEVTGRAADDRALSIICAFKDETSSVLLITAYEGG